MLRILLGTDWVTVREEILDRIARDVAQEQGNRILMVPELISHDMERRLCAAAGDTASRYAQVLSFTRLARRVSETVGSGAMLCMDNGGRVVAMAAAARSLHSRLKAYASVETKPEFLLQLLDAVDEFKRCCIRSQDLRSAAAQMEGSFAQKLEELALLMETYDGLCARGKRDPRDQMSWLLEQLEEGTFAQQHTFYIDGFPDFTRQHMEILEHLIRVSPTVTVGLHCDAPNSQDPAFEKAGDTAAQLISIARRLEIPVEIHNVLPEESPLAAVRSRLFQGKLPADPVSGVEAIRTDSPFAEVQAAANRVLKLTRGGCRYRDIGIVCGDLAGYQNAISMVFGRSGIPVYQAGTEDILQKTVISTVLSALNAALDGFEQSSTLRYLKSVFSPLDQDTCDEVENYAIIWGIRGKKWLSPWSAHPDGLNGIPSAQADAKLRRLEQARQLAMGPLERLRRNFTAGINLARQVEAVYAFLEEIGLDQRLDQLARQLDATGDNRGAQILDQLWEILLSALEQMHDVLGQTVWDPETFTRLFTLLLSQYDVGTIPPVLDAVTVGAVSAMRCQQVKHLIVLGMEEGALPGYGGSQGLLSDQERETLRALGVTLTGGAMEGLQAEFAEIGGVFCGARESVFVTCSDAQPSYLYNRLAKMAGGEAKYQQNAAELITDPREAGTYLARWREKNLAEDLCLERWYQDACDRVDHKMGAISKEHIRSLYGNTLNLSASQIDRQAECRMSYFLRYGLRAKERKEATVDPAEFGTYVHAVLEETARDVMKKGGFQVVSLEETMQIAMTHSDAYTQAHFQQLDSQRLAYLFRRNKRELEMVVQELWQELKNARFQPADFELSFGEQGKMPGVCVGTAEMPAVLRGFVDRVDIWQENGQNYFRVVDYKTGKKDFDYCDVYNGVGLQMLLYLFALQQGGSAIVGNRGVAAGVQYFPARVPLITADGKLSDAEAEEARRKEWKRRGLLLHDEAVLEAMDPEESGRLCCTRKKDGTLSGDLADREQMKQLENYLFRLLEKMVEDIASGNVEPNPYTRGTSHDACTFCPYGTVCQKGTVTGRRNYKAMTAQRFWEEIGKEDTNG